MTRELLDILEIFASFIAGMVFCLAVIRARRTRTLDRAERALDQPCPRCGIERWRGTQAFAIRSKVESICICSFTWPSVLESERIKFAG